MTKFVTVPRRCRLDIEMVGPVLYLQREIRHDSSVEETRVEHKLNDRKCIVQTVETCSVRIGLRCR